MTAHKVLMVAPKHFISNPQTVGDNFFQGRDPNLNDHEIAALVASEEFESLALLLTKSGIEAHVFRQEDELQTPDAIFPNNWMSTLPGGILLLYPMMAENRRLERRPAIIEKLSRSYPKRIDLTYDEQRGIFLEGTGSLVIDHDNKIAYASLSQRTSSNMAYEWSKLTGYEVILFTSYDKNDALIYHTNVMMCVAEKFAILCAAAITDIDGRERVMKSLQQTGHEIIEISLDQMHHFCGNCLALSNSEGKRFLLMSTQAFEHFTQDQKNRIGKFCTILHTGLQTIETYGGGGARCMVAELF